MAGVNGTNNHVIEDDNVTYESIMGIPTTGDVGGGATALSKRLAAFREWLTNEAKVTVHPSLCIVNGEATDGVKNAPVLLFGPPHDVIIKNLAANKVGRCGMVDKTEDQALYDRAMGCQVRAAREIKKDDVLMTIPRTAMITPDVVASSDAGRAILSCCKPPPESTTIEFWDVFENTAMGEKRYADNVARNSGTQLLVKILQDRKKAEAAFNKASTKLEESGSNGETNEYELAAPGTISTRAPFLAFLIQQRFANELSQPVTSERSAGLENETNESALQKARRLDLPPDTPETFSPYARTLPSSVAVPICWKRNELALLAGCILGTDALKEVSSRTALLAAEFIALLKAGLLERFPTIFPPGMITWERWIWAAAVFGSRVLPVSCFLNEGDEDAVAHFKGPDSAIQSSPEVWEELGLLIPLQDMLNHEIESQVTWEPNVPKKNEIEEDEEEKSHPPRAIAHSRIKKGAQLYATYGLKGNQNFIVQYGFALVGSTDDAAKIGFALADAVGNVPPPSDYSPPEVPDKKEDASEPSNDSSNKPALKESLKVYDSIDAEPMNLWWTEDRLKLLEREALLTSHIVDSLKKGKKLTALAYGDGRYHPTFLSAVVIGTMPVSDVKRCLKQGNEDGTKGVALSKTHQEILRQYLQFFFSRKMEKLLQNLNNALKNHFSVQLWTKVTQGGLQYNGEKARGGEGTSYEGWQTFFDTNAYATSMECEGRYYAIGSDSCVLAMYDGHVRAIQASIDGTLSQEAFEKGPLQELKDIGFVLLDDDVKMIVEDVAPSNNATGVENKEKDAPKDKVSEQKDRKPNDSGKSGSKSGRRRNRKRNGGGGGGGGGGDRPPALKLHIGNLAFTTQPPELFEYFAALYGRENILECHIPTERDTGRSRGFGFVTFPEVIAIRVLQSGRKHEIAGRVLKVAESNSTAGRSRGSGGSGSAVSDRCASCGYRPKYCVCSGRPVPMLEGPPRHYYGDMRGPPPDYPPDPYYGGRGHDDRRRRSYSRSPSYERGGRRGRSRDRDYPRDYDRDYYDRDYYDRGSRSYGRGDSGDRGRRERDRSHDRSRERSRGRSRRSRSPGRPRSRHGRRGRSPSRSIDSSRSRSHSGERSSRRDREGNEDVMGSTGGLGASSPAVRSGGSVGGSDRKRDSAKRSRSRSRGRSGKRRKSSKKEGSRRHRSRSRSPRTPEG
jgi:RNA recognition motif-containing protein